MAVAGEVLKERLMGFLMWETILSSGAFILFSIFRLMLSSDYKYSFSSASLAVLAFTEFLVSSLIFSSTIHAITLPQPVSSAAPSELILSLLRFVFFASPSKSGSSQAIRSRFAFTSLLISFFVCVSVSSVMSITSITNSGSWKVVTRSFVTGAVYAFVYLYNQRWILSFPVIQRPLFFSFKLGIYPAILKSFKLANAAYFFSLLASFNQGEFSSKSSPSPSMFRDEILQYLGTFIVFLCWEMIQHLYQILHTKRVTYSPPKGSFAEPHPSEQLLAALEDTPPGSLVQCLAYLDLCMVCENNVHASRRSAFFEETGETYKRVVSACLKPLEQFISNVNESFPEKGRHLPTQMLSPSDPMVFSNANAFNNFQQCAWGARAAASLTARSHTEDRFGVAQLSGSNALVISTLISALLAVEAVMGKKTTARLKNNSVGFSLMKSNFGSVVQKPRSGVILAKAYALADVLRSSVYCIVSSFYEEMVACSKSGNLEKDWVVSVKVPFGSKDIVLQKLRLFIDCKAN